MPLPCVERSTVARAIGDLLDLPTGEDLDGLTNQVLAIDRENPQVLRAVELLVSDEPANFRHGALMGMAVTYNVLRAQLEIEDLNRLAMATEAVRPESDRRVLLNWCRIKSRGRWVFACIGGIPAMLRKRKGSK